MYTPPVKEYDFLLRRALDAEELLATVTGGTASVDDATDVLEGLADVVGPIAALNATGDKVGSKLQDGNVVTPPGFKEAFDAYVEGGWMGLAVPESFGGAGMPRTLAAAADEFLSAASLSFSGCTGLTAAALEVFAAVDDPELTATYVPHLLSGKWTGTMDMTEPQAGTDLSAIRTIARAQDDGTWRVSGQKMFISWGDHDLAENIVHLVLARTPDAPPGLAGLSLFVVPKFLPRPDGGIGDRNAVECVSLEHKLGIHATPTCVIDYGAATGFLIGELHRGLHAMFVVMNSARMSTGVHALGVADRAYQKAKAYAEERVQGRVVGREPGTPISGHPDVRRLLLSMSSGLTAMRALAVQTAAWRDLSTKRSPEAKAAAGLAQLFLPVVKGWLTETGVQIASDAIQVHGGMGYIEETGVAQHLRDVRILSIYEGTTAVQANHLVGRGLTRDEGATAYAALELMDEARLRLGDVDHPVAGTLAERLDKGIAQVRESTSKLLRSGKNPRDVFAAAVPYLHMWGLLAGGWMHARILRAALDGDDRSRDRRILEAHFYAVHYLSGLWGLADIIEAGEIALTAEPALFQ
jgi:alkylation response protein AidB-like acyl-CoA dehydrogenase